MISWVQHLFEFLCEEITITQRGHSLHCHFQQRNFQSFPLTSITINDINLPPEMRFSFTVTVGWK